MATKKVSVNYDFGLNQLLNFLLQPLSTAPAVGVGRIYYDSALKQIGISDGTNWFYASNLTSDGIKALVGGMLVGTQIVPTYDSTAKTVTFTIGSAVITNAHVASNAGISADKLADGANYVVMSTTERSKLQGIAAGATNYTNAMALANTLDKFAVPTAALSLGNQRIANLADPVNPTDATTKQYVDAISQGLDVKASVRVASRFNLSSLSGQPSIDNIIVNPGDRVLLKDQTNAWQNGIYVVAAGTWTRAADADNIGNTSEVTPGMFTFVEDGQVNAASGWLLTTKGTITLGTTNLTFSQFSGAGVYTAGNGISINGQIITAVTSPGGGLQLTSSGIQLDPTVAARISSFTVGDGSATSFICQHNFLKRTVIVAITDTSTYEDVDAYVVKTSPNAVTVTFNIAPTTGQYLVTVLG